MASPPLSQELNGNPGLRSPPPSPQAVWPDGKAAETTGGASRFVLTRPDSTSCWGVRAPTGVPGAVAAHKHLTRGPRFAVGSARTHSRLPLFARQVNASLPC